MEFSTNRGEEVRIGRFSTKKNIGSKDWKWPKMNFKTNLFFPILGVGDHQWSMRLGLHSRDRYRDFFFLGLKFETETETQIFGISRSRVWRDFFSDFFETETETETELFIFSRPRLRPRLGWVSKSRLFETETFPLWLLIRCLGRNFNLLRQVETYP